MSKIKDLFTKLIGNIKITFEKFPVTMTIIFLLTIFISVTIDTKIISEKIFGEIIFTGCITAVGTIFSETYIKENKKLKYILLIGSLILALFFDFSMFDRFDFLSENYVQEIYLIPLLLAYISTAILLTIYKMYKNSKLSINDYLLRIASESFIVSITYTVLSIGISAVCGIFISLILESEYFFIVRMLILAFGLYYVPSVISVFTNSDKIKINSFVEKLVLYVIMPLTVISILIIYIYIAKIIILRDMPKNVICRILIAIYIFAFLVWLLTNGMKNEKTKKITNKIPYMYMPLIILEIYSIAVRIVDFGFTPARYAVVLFIIFQLISFILVLLKKENNFGEMILLGTILILVFLISPINQRIVSLNSQSYILKQYKDQGINIIELDNKQRKKYIGAYNYLNMQIDSEKYINRYFDEKDKNDFGNNNYSTYVSTTKYVYETAEFNDVDVSNYSKIYSFNTEYNENYNPSEIKLFYNNEQNELKVDLVKYIDKIMQNNNKNSYFSSYDDSSNYFKENNIVKINDNISIYLTNISFSYNEDTSELNSKNSIDIRGYILEK